MFSIDGQKTPMSETTTARVKASIRMDILRGILSAGSRINLQELAKRYGISAIPIREAVRELAGEGLVELHAHKGAVVRGVDRRFVRNMYDIRAALEQMLVSAAIKRLGAVELQAIRTAAADYEARSSSGDVQAMLASNVRLHRTINKAADNPEALRILEQGWELVLALRFYFGFGEDRMAAIREDHRALVDALERRSETDAVEISRAHCERACRDLVQQMERADIK